jgi:alkanesulfonate monooxygenase SsuD/methylene tetrahydromethanopterin reductase-like flavin-dependent oxidoreductase (luciferase family)
VRLGTTVIVLPYRHPLLVARMAGNLDELSGGRLHEPEFFPDRGL